MLTRPNSLIVSLLEILFRRTDALFRGVRDVGSDVRGVIAGVIEPGGVIQLLTISCLFLVITNWSE